jgi:hypothetical protein
VPGTALPRFWRQMRRDSPGVLTPSFTHHQDYDSVVNGYTERSRWKRWCTFFKELLRLPTGPDAHQQGGDRSWPRHTQYAAPRSPVAAFVLRDGERGAMGHAFREELHAVAVE